jgi:hypothetical protein
LAELTVELLAEALELIDRKAAELRPEDWEWSAIGDNNLLAGETAMGLAKLLGLAAWDDRARALRQVARAALYRRWEARYRAEELVRLLRAAAAALERCEVASDPTGAAEEAAATLAQVVTLSGDYVPVPDLPDPMKAQ